MISLLLTSPLGFVILALILLLSLSVHEFAHAITADRLGDPTPRAQGRVTLNPLKHLDPVGTILLLIVGFGWGKPVMYDPYNLRHPHRDAMYIAFAGPLSNILIALLFTVGIRVFGDIQFIVSTIMVYAIQLNIMLALFNLIPVAPLDGFKIVSGLLNERQRDEWMGLERLGPFFLLALILPIINGQSMIGVWLSPVITKVTAFLTGMGSIL